MASRNNDILELMNNLESAENALRDRRLFAEADAVNLMRKLAASITFDYVNEQNKGDN